LAKSFSIKIEGLAELEDALLNKTVREARAAMRAALKDAGNVMRNAIAQRAPIRTGFLAKNIVTKIQLSVKEDEGKVSVGPAREAFYAGFIEFGTKTLQPPRPFMTVAFNENKEAMTDAFNRRLRQELGL